MDVWVPESIVRTKSACFSSRGLTDGSCNNQLPMLRTCSEGQSAAKSLTGSWILQLLKTRQLTFDQHSKLGKQKLEKLMQVLSVDHLWTNKEAAMKASGNAGSWAR